MPSIKMNKLDIHVDLITQASLVFPKSAMKKTPLVVVPHGGPHAVSTDQFKSEVYFLSQLGN